VQLFITGLENPLRKDAALM
jgi:hypothetical protein